MATATAEHRAPRSATEQIAWGIIWIAFAVFCIIAVIFVTGIYYFLFNSIVPMPATLNVSRGTLGVTTTDLLELVVRDNRGMQNGEVISIPPDTQGVLLIDDDMDAMTGHLVAITLRGESVARFVSALRPRFDWGVESYRITLGDIQGDFDIWIASELSRNVQVEMLTASGDLAYLDRAGSYSVSVRGDHLEVISYRGAALLAADDRSIPASEIPAGSRGLLRMSSNEILLLPGFIDLLGGLAFNPDTLISANPDTPSEVLASPLTWICFNPLNTQQPRGTYGVEAVDGRLAVHIARGQDATTHGETRCTQRFGPGSLGIDISGYNYLGLRATFRIEGQSLAVCGVAGSECPLMLNMQYIPAIYEPTSQVARDADVFGSIFDPLRPGPARNWRKGFYAVSRGTTTDAPLRCDTCLQEHSFVRPNAWYTYDSGNLLTPFAADDRPRYLLNFSFYASGHQFDVYVSEMMLLVGNVGSS
jgi:hypothetical protein